MTRPVRPALAWVESVDGARLRVEGDLDSSRLAIVPAALLRGASAVRGLQSVAGRFERVGDHLEFAPRFAFSEGVEYALAIRTADGYEALASLVHPRSEDAPGPEVLAVHPGAHSVPVNLLRIYVHFSKPMRRGGVASGISMTRSDSGAPLLDVFVPDLELWDPSHRRLTLLLDPGRIKRGLLPHQQLGYPLIEGVPFTVRISERMRDADGHSLQRSAERTFDVGPAIRRRIDPARWRVGPLEAGTTVPLEVTFDEALDRGILEHALTVVDRRGARVEGRTSIAAGERAWSFTPAAAWQRGAYTIEVDARLEDVAGNSMLRVFDRDLREDNGPSVSPRVSVHCEPVSTAASR